MAAELPRDLGGGLVLRRSTAADAGPLATFNVRVHSDDPEAGPDSALAVWVEDLMSGEHPTFDPGDFTIVEDTTTGAIVSSQCLIPQTWSYVGTEFKVGRIELVGTEPGYRRRGLVAAQIAVAHEWCRESGLVVQGITGIPHYYRRFGYEMALQCAGGRAGLAAGVPDLVDGATEPYTVRPVSPDDAAFLVECAAPARERWLVTDAWDEATLGFTAAGRTSGSLTYFDGGVIEDADGRPAGFVLHLPRLDGGRVRVAGYELAPGRRWPDVTPSVLRYLKEWGAKRAAAKGEPVTEIAFDLGEHPVTAVAGKFLRRTWIPYGWYVRVPDLRGFLETIAAVLEARLAGSAWAGYGGEFRILAGDDGLVLRFADGRLTGADSRQAGSFEDGDVMFPGRTFLQALFGFRSFAELQEAYPDCAPYTDAGAGLTEALFPRAPSYVMGVS